MACVGVLAEFCDSCIRYVLMACIRGVGACRTTVAGRSSMASME